MEEYELIFTGDKEVLETILLLVEDASDEDRIDGMFETQLKEKGV